MNVKGILEALVAAQIQKTIAGGVVRAGAGGILGNLSRVLATRAGSAVAGVLVSMVLGSRKGGALGSKLGRLGGLAAIGALAWQAYGQWQADRAPQPAGKPPSGARRAAALEVGDDPFGLPPEGSPLSPADGAQEEELSRLLVRAMIAAAKADGRIDEQERAAIGGELRNLQLSEEDRAFVTAEIAAPLDIDRVARGAIGDPQLGTAIYAASLLAITVDTPQERDYLAALAGKLELDPALVATLLAKVAEAAPDSGAGPAGPAR